VDVERRMSELKLSMGAMQARVDQIEPMVVDLTTTVEVRQEREETVVPQSPLMGGVNCCRT